MSETTDTAHMQTDCRSEEGQTVGLVDAIITISRALKGRSLESEPVREALRDLRSDPDIAAVVWAGPVMVNVDEVREWQERHTNLVTEYKRLEKEKLEAHEAARMAPTDQGQDLADAVDRVKIAERRNAELTKRLEAATETVRDLLRSAHPHPTEHRGMYAAWQKARAALETLNQPLP